VQIDSTEAHKSLPPTGKIETTDEKRRIAKILRSYDPKECLTCYGNEGNMFGDKDGNRD
jgi:hypothetical protein